MSHHPKRLVLLFLREPAPGLVKTRLAATLGAETAAAAYRLMVETVVRGLGAGQHLQLVYTPAEPGIVERLLAWLSPLWAGHNDASLTAAAQVQGGLGERLTAAFAEAFAAGYEQVAAIGSDCLDLDKTFLQAAWSTLAEPGTDVVLGPADDGGYTLIAMKRLHPEVFLEIPWSTALTLEVTLQRARDAGLAVGLLPLLRDIDTETEWLEAAARHGLPARPDW